MGHYVFKLPDVGEGTAEAEIAAWHVVVGDRIDEDQPLVDVMTDKATVEITSPVSGRVISLHGAVGEKIAVGSDLVVFEVEGEGTDEAAKTPSVAAPSPAQTPRAEAKPRAVGPPMAPRSEITDEPSALRRIVEATQPAFATRTPGEKPLAAPAVRRRARRARRGAAIRPRLGTGRTHHACRSRRLPRRRRCQSRAAATVSALRQARASRSTRSSASGARSPSGCRRRSGAFRTSPTSRKWT